MIFQKTVAMIPLILGLSSNNISYSRTDLSFNEEDVKNNLINIDQSVLSYKDLSNRFMFDNLYLKTRFDYYHEKWVKETMILSNAKSITANSNFQKIVSYGSEIVPILLRELENKPSNLVWAMNHILNRKISNNSLTITEASKAWVSWGKLNQII
jgi:hypothetical protein